MSTRANLTEAAGLSTSQNELLRPVGSQEEALNVNIDQRGLITPRRGFSDYLNPTTGAEALNVNVKQIFDYKDRIFRHYSDKLEVELSTGSFAPISGSFNEVLNNIRIKYKEANSNMYFTTDEGIKKISVESQSDLDNPVTVLDAGAIKATYLEGKAIPTTGGFLPAQSRVAYRFLFGYKDASNNLILGVPSYRHVVTNFAEDADVKEVIHVTVDAPINGDYFVITTKNGTKYAPYIKSGTDTPPRTALTIGAKLITVDVGNSVPLNETVAAILANVLQQNIPEFTFDFVNNVLTLTSNESGNIPNVVSGQASFESSEITPGNDSLGSSCKVSLELVIPPEATSDYFVQVYRSAFITAVEGLSVIDIDPGDELNLVYEEGLTSAHISSGSLVFVDNTPESFRASSTPLYINQISGEGILQANERPPIAQDIELFRNSLFYANTKNKHFLNLDIIDVSDFQSGKTKFVISNSDITRYYTFIGERQKYTINMVAETSINDGSYYTIFSTSDQRKYVAYFAKSNATVAPNVTDAIIIKVDLTSTTSFTNNQVAQAFVDAFLPIIDFNVSRVNNVVTIEWEDNGETTGLTETTSTNNSAPVLVTVGQGEDASQNEVLLSDTASSGQLLDISARSLVKVINKDSLSPVIAEYISNEVSLPGKIRLENKSQKDEPFYVSIIDEDKPELAEEFNPIINYVKQLEEVEGEGSTTLITLTAHGFITGQSVYVSYQKESTETADLDSFHGFYSITYVNDDTFRIDQPNTDDEVTTLLDNSFAGLLPEAVSDNQETQNRIYFSKFREPEAVPSLNFFDVGASDEPIRRILALRDNLFVLKNDGIFIVSGSSAPNFSVRRLDNARIIATDSAVVLNNQIYCLTEQGIVIITESGAGIISRNIENLVDDVVNLGSEFLDKSFGIAYEQDRAYLLFTPKDATDTNPTQAFRYNIFERTWTRWEYNTTCGKVLPRDNKLYLGNGDRNYISQERKNKNRTDFSDRDFTLSIVSNGVDGKSLRISATNEIQIHDAIVQRQEVTISYFNRLLRKMDTFDNGLVAPIGSTFLDSFKAVSGDRIDIKILALNDYLNTLDSDITIKPITSVNKKEQLDLLIDELNDPDTITLVKDYKKPEVFEYETFVVAVDRLNNEITVNDARPFLEDDFTVYKHYDKVVRWNVQHYGDPTAFKQVSYVTIMFDQNNFNTAIAKFGSDLAQDLAEVNFKGKGIGYWGDLPWGGSTNYWGGIGNDIPFRTMVPRAKQKCRYLTLQFEHKNAREVFRIVGISSVVRAFSSKAYR